MPMAVYELMQKGRQWMAETNTRFYVLYPAIWVIVVGFLLVTLGRCP